MDKNSISEQIKQEALYGVVPVAKEDRIYGFWDAFLVLSGFAIATWCYTQGAFQVGLVDFKRFVLTIFACNLLALGIYVLTGLGCNKYGIDLWIWLKSIYGTTATKILIIIIIIVNFPWYGVCANIFASSMMNLFAAFGINIPEAAFMWLGFLCVASGTWIALSGPLTIRLMSRILIPVLILVGLIIVIIAFRAVPASEIWNYQPEIEMSKVEGYMLSFEAAMGFAFSWSLCTGVTPRICRKQRDGYWATLGAYGVISPFFIFIGGVLAVAVYIQTGIFPDGEPTAEIIQIAGPAVSLASLLMVAFANIGTQGIGEYLWGIVLKAAFPNTKYWVVVIALAVYTMVITAWGQILVYFGTMITLSACIYGPVMGCLLIDFFFLRKQKLSLRSAYEIDGHKAYYYTGGFNIVGIACTLLGTAFALLIFDPIGYVSKSPIFYGMGASLFGMVVTAILYWVSTAIPAIRKYMLADRNEITV